ncbi:MAG: hypothetical protein K6T59_11420 [Bryobacteraceae bacterium]|jgi:hypothetical protein|nr:hypothetical protein [Bryobacteraceae bacterium]
MRRKCARAAESEVRDADKAFNLSAIKRLARQAVAVDPATLESASGRTYFPARRPELYAKLIEPNPHLGPGGRPEVWWKKHRQASAR